MGVDLSRGGDAAPPGHPAGRARLGASRLLGVAGIASYNGWIGVLVGGRLAIHPNGFFSDLEAVGQPGAALLSALDVAAGVLLLAALLLRGRDAPDGPRPEWPWLVVFAAAGAVGGWFPYQCAEGTDASCRSAEWRFQLPWPHYLHIVAGIVEFATATLAVLLARRRTAGRQDGVGAAVRGVAWALVVAYPLLAVAYLTDRLGAVVEPVFFVGFSVLVAVEVFERQLA